MKKRTEEKLERIQAGHDWAEGQTYGHGGTAYSREDRCRYCGLVRRWRSDRQNGIHDDWRFTDPEGDDMSLRDVSDSCEARGQEETTP